MLNDNIHPSTLGGIKRLAKQIKKANGVPHNEALDLAAKRASFENYAHAHRLLQNSPTAKSGCQLFFTVYWYERESNEFGREVLEIALPKPLPEIATKSEIKKSPGLSWFRLASPDHLVHDDVSHSQEAARKKICKAVREIRFIEATGLKPSTDFLAAYPNRDRYNRLPNSDHSSDWYDPDTGQAILIDEPYLKPVVDGDRAKWAQMHGWHLKVSNWEGMYYPGMSVMFVATDASTGYDIDALMAKIDSIPSPVTEENWTGISSQGFDTFFSPLCTSSQDKKRAVAKGTIIRASSSKTQPMRRWGSSDNERRPNAVMPVEDHQLAARLIKAIYYSDASHRAVQARLSPIRSKLEDWFFSEHDRSITNEFDLFYYGGIDENDPLVLRAQSPKGVVSMLQELKTLLQEAYVDCDPLRRMVGKVDTSIKLTSKLL